MNKVSVCYLVLFLFSAVGINGAAYEGFTITKTPGYRDTMIKVHGWCDKGKLFAEVAKEKGVCYVELPLVFAGLSDGLVKKCRMKIYHTNEQRMQLVKSPQDAPIPALLTSGDAAKVLISQEVNGQLQVLFTKEGRRGTSLPGGTLDPQEGVCEAALRELHEELGLTVTLDKLMFLGALNRVKLYGYGVTHNEFVFHLPYDGQKITPDGKEVKSIVWASVEDVLKRGTVAGVSVLQHHLLVLEFLSQGKKGKPCVSLPDYRQLNPRTKKDPSDIMMFLPAE